MDGRALEGQISKLWLEQEADLYTTLGINEKAVQKARRENDEWALERAKQVDARFSVQDTDFDVTETDMGAADFFRGLGEKWWKLLEPKLYELICVKESAQHASFMEVAAQAPKELAILLFPTLTASLAGAVPAVVAVIATIAAKKIAEAGLEAACQVWSEARTKPAEEPKEPADAPPQPPAPGPTDAELLDFAD
jgi:hypothetical protein